MDEYTPALKGEAYFGDRLADFVEKSHFSSADIICSDSFAKITADKNRDDFDIVNWGSNNIARRENKLTKIDCDINVADGF